MPFNKCLFDFTWFVVSRSSFLVFNRVGTSFLIGFQSTPLLFLFLAPRIVVLGTAQLSVFVFDKIKQPTRFTAEVFSEDSILLFGSLPSCDAFLSLWIRCIPQYYGGLLPDIFTV